jgi:hypothetical protein
VRLAASQAASSFWHRFVAASLSLSPFFDSQFYWLTGLHRRPGWGAVADSAVFLLACLAMFVALFWQRICFPIPLASQATITGDWRPYSAASFPYPKFTKGEKP